MAHDAVSKQLFTYNRNPRVKISRKIELGSTQEEYVPPINEGKHGI